jgi:glycosyltransferase involved in cell wall biosynthesis
LVIHALHGGGAERVAADMANLWVGQGEQVALITLDSVESDVYRVDQRVERVGLGLMGTSRSALQAIRNNRRRIRSLRAALQEAQPDCIVSVTDRMNIVTLLACRGWKTPVVIAEHSDPRHQHLGLVWERLRRWTYPQAAAAVVLTRPVADHLRTRFPDLPVHVVPNGIAAPPDRVAPAADQVSPLVVAMGRLSNEKGFDLLIDAFAEVAPRHQAWRLEIAGEGPERAPLQQRIARHALEDRVQLVGWVDDPVRFLARASVFVLSSRYEGFPVALLEAMAAGLAVASFDCDSGPREIVRHEWDGLLVSPQDRRALAGAIDRLLANSQLRQQLGQAAREVVDRFSCQQFAEQWNKILNDAVPPRL